VRHSPLPPTYRHSRLFFLNGAPCPLFLAEGMRPRQHTTTQRVTTRSTQPRAYHTRGAARPARATGSNWQLAGRLARLATGKRPLSFAYTSMPAPCYLRLLRALAAPPGLVDAPALPPWRKAAPLLTRIGRSLYLTLSTLFPSTHALQGPLPSPAAQSLRTDGTN
jgi:hypothetical protein